jgi:hypothetical protein
MGAPKANTVTATIVTVNMVTDPLDMDIVTDHNFISDYYHNYEKSNLFFLS